MRRDLGKRPCQSHTRSGTLLLTFRFCAAFDQKTLVPVRTIFLRRRRKKPMLSQREPRKPDVPPLGGRLPALDGLRGLAAILVVFHHCFIWPMLFAKGIVSTAAFSASYGRNLLPVALWYGYSGVELFFLLSGLCLFFPIFSNPQKRFSVRTYAIQRFKRIYPPYLATLVLAASLAAVAWAKVNAHLHYATEPVTARGIVTSLFLTESHYCATFWSLVVEAQWYLFVPILVILWRRRSWALHLGMLGVIASVMVLSKQGTQLHLDDVLHLSTLALYLPMFWVGIILAEIATVSNDYLRVALRRGGWLVLILIGVFAIYRFAPRPPDWGFTRSQAYPFGIFYAGILAAALFTNVGKKITFFGMDGSGGSILL